MLDLRKEGDPSKHIPAGDTTGCMRSRNYPLADYYPSLFDEVYLINNGHEKLHIIFEHLEVSYFSCYLVLVESFGLVKFFA